MRRDIRERETENRAERGEERASHRREGRMRGGRELAGAAVTERERERERERIVIRSKWVASGKIIFLQIFPLFSASSVKRPDGPIIESGRMLLCQSMIW
jgi:hypothetical protein